MFQGKSSVTQILQRFFKFHGYITFSFILFLSMLFHFLKTSMEILNVTRDPPPRKEEMYWVGVSILKGKTRGRPRCL
jgi:hypothetical protein